MNRANGIRPADLRAGARSGPGLPRTDNVGDVQRYMLLHQVFQVVGQERNVFVLQKPRHDSVPDLADIATDMGNRPLSAGVVPDKFGTAKSRGHATCIEPL